MLAKQLSLLQDYTTKFEEYLTGLENQLEGLKHMITDLTAASSPGSLKLGIDLQDLLSEARWKSAEIKTAVGMMMKYESEIKYGILTNTQAQRESLMQDYLGKELYVGAKDIMNLQKKICSTSTLKTE